MRPGRSMARKVFRYLKHLRVRTVSVTVDALLGGSTTWPRASCAPASAARNSVCQDGARACCRAHDQGRSEPCHVAKGHRYSKPGLGRGSTRGQRRSRAFTKPRSRRPENRNPGTPGALPPSSQRSVGVYEAVRGYVVTGVLVAVIGGNAAALAVSKLRAAKRWPFAEPS
jgi:hypothetical protein